MRTVRRCWLRLVAHFRPRRTEGDLSAELESHLDLHVADNLRAGMTREEARRRALVDLGGLQQTKEQIRDRVRWPAFEDGVRDGSVAIRMLIRDRGFTITAACVLGLGIAVTNTFFILTNAIVVRGLPIEEPDRVLILRVRDTADRNLGMSYEDFRDIASSAQSFARIGAFETRPMTIGDETHVAERFEGAKVTPEVLTLFGETPLIGRSFQPGDDGPAAPPVVILGRSMWESRYSGDPGVLGATVRVDGRPATVIGVIPDRSRFPTNAAVWVPLGSSAGIAQLTRSARNLIVFGRLSEGVSRAEAAGELQSVWAGLAQQFPASNANLRLVVQPINNHYVGDRTHPAWIAFIAVGFLVLAVACANVANLLIMRGTNRAREIAVRTSLGATRSRIVRQLLAEHVVLALLGGVVGLILSTVGARLLWGGIPEGMLPHWMDFRMDPPMFGLLAAVCLGSSLVFGLVPAFQLSKGNLDPVLKAGARGTSRGVPSRRLTSTLLVAQFAVALGSLISISSAVRGLGDEGLESHINTDGLVTMSVALPQGRYGTRERRSEFYDRLSRRFSELDQVTSVALASNLPLGGAPTRALIPDGQAADSKGPRPTVRGVSISPGYFDTLGVPLVQGRTFTDEDGSTAEASVIVNRRFVELHFPDRSPLGQSIVIANEGVAAPERFTIVGVSPNLRQRPQPKPDPVVYFPHRQSSPAQSSILVRGPADQTAIASALRQAMHSLDPEIPLYGVMSLERSMNDSNWNGRFSSAIANVTAVLTVLLSAIGLFALTAHAVSCMTPEIGMRAALGAASHNLLWRVMRRAVVQVALGVLAGLAFAIVWNRLLGNENSPTGVGPIDFVLAAVMLAAVSCAACVVPALRALRVNPVVALRYE